MTAVLTSIAPVVLALAAAGGIRLRARRRRQPELVPAYAPRRAEPAQPERARRQARGCNW